MTYGAEWADWLLDEEEAIKHIKYAYVLLWGRELALAEIMACRYDAGIQTFDTAPVRRMSCSCGKRTH